MSRGGFKRYACLGPGGWDCPCCTPAPPGKKMKKFFRIWKKRERQDAHEEIKQQLEGV